MRKVAGKHPGLTDWPSSDPPQLPKSQNNYLALPDSRGQSKQGQWAINHPGLFSQLFGRNSEWKENGLLCIGFLLAPREADWPSSAAAATLSWEKITEAGWIPDNLVEIKSCLIQFLSKYWKHFEFSQLSLPVQSDEEHIRLTTNQSSEIIKMEQFISRPGSSFPCLQVVAQLHERLARGIQSKSSRWLRVMNFSKTLQFPSSRNDYTFIFLKRKVKRGSPWFTGNLGSRNSRSLVRITPNSGDRHLSVIAGTHTDSARRAQSIRQSFLTNNPLRPPDGSSISLLLSRDWNTLLSG